MSHIILHIPHSSRYIPSEIRDSICLSDAELERELSLITDHMAAELFDLEGAVRVVYPVSRLVADPEKHTDEEQEPMARYGMGVVYTKCQDGKALRKELSEESRQSIIEGYYNPHHQALEEAVANVLREHGKCVIVDCRSFATLPLDYKKSQDGRRPKVFLGIDEFHTLADLVESVKDSDCELADDIAIIESSPGALVPSKYRRENRLVQSIALEVRRDLYWNQKENCPSEGWEETKQELGAMLLAIETSAIFESYGEESYCPYCGAFSEYPSDNCCRHKLGFGQDSGGYFLFNDPGKPDEIWSFGSEVGDAWWSMVMLAEDNPDAFDALERQFQDEPSCLALIRDHFRKEDLSFPWGLCGEVRTGGCFVTGGLASDTVETWYAEDVRLTKDLVRRIEAMWEWLEQSGLME
jgi:N-formylglutamate deformylase